MIKTFSSALTIFACLLGWADLTPAQAPSKAPIIFSTLPKKVMINLKIRVEPKVFYQADGLLSFTITAANNDDTVTGVMIYTITDSARQKISQLTNTPLNLIPASLIKKDIVASFRTGTACPTLQLELGTAEYQIAGIKANLAKIEVDVVETSEPVPQYFCAWTRQINAKRQRRGIIAALNRLIVGEQ